MVTHEMLKNLISAAIVPSRSTAGNGSPEDYYQFEDGDVGYLYQFLGNADLICEVIDDDYSVIGKMLQHILQRSDVCVVCIAETNELWACVIAEECYAAVKRFATEGVYS